MHNVFFQQVVVSLDARINMDDNRLLPHEKSWVKGERAKKAVLDKAKAQKLVRISQPSNVHSLPYFYVPSNASWFHHGFMQQLTIL
jgi:hypothetical protein